MPTTADRRAGVPGEDAPERVLVLTGRLDVRTAAEIREVLHTALDEGVGILVVDLSGIEGIDAAGLGVLVGTHRLAVRDGRRLLLRNVPPRTARLLAATRLHRVLEVDLSGARSAASL